MCCCSELLSKVSGCDSGGAKQVFWSHGEDLEGRNLKFSWKWGTTYLKGWIRDCDLGCWCVKETVGEEYSKLRVANG